MHFGSKIKLSKKFSRRLILFSPICLTLASLCAPICLLGTKTNTCLYFLLFLWRLRRNQSCQKHPPRIFRRQTMPASSPFSLPAPSQHRGAPVLPSTCMLSFLCCTRMWMTLLISLWAISPRKWGNFHRQAREWHASISTGLACGAVCWSIDDFQSPKLQYFDPNQL